MLYAVELRKRLLFGSGQNKNRDFVQLRKIGSDVIADRVCVKSATQVVRAVLENFTFLWWQRG